MKLLRLLQEYPLRDLVCHAMFEARSRLDCAWSTFIFTAKCALVGIGIGRRSKVWGKVIVGRFPGSTIQIGDDVRIISRPYRYAFNIFPQSRIRTYSKSARVIIGNGVGFNALNIFARSTTVQIGDRTMIGGNCQIMDSDGHPLWPAETRWHYPGNEHDASVTIGRNVFIGLNVIVLKGAAIGDNSVIGAGSVVVGKIPANVLAVGAPARVIRCLDEKVPQSADKMPDEAES